jgi:hypothetical protein
LVRKDSNLVELKSDGNTKVVLHASPFKLELYSDDNLIALFNSKNLLKFEHLRTKEYGKSSSFFFVVVERVSLSNSLLIFFKK